MTRADRQYRNRALPASNACHVHQRLMKDSRAVADPDV